MYVLTNFDFNSINNAHLPCGQRNHTTMERGSLSLPRDALGSSKKVKLHQVNISTSEKWQAQLNEEYQTMRWPCLVWSQTIPLWSRKKNSIAKIGGEGSGQMAYFATYIAKAGMLQWVIIAYGTCDKCVVCMCSR